MKKVIFLVLSLLVGGGFYALISQTSSIINLLPFAIHQQFFRKVIREDLFILIFDIFLALILAFVLYRYLRKKYL